MDDVIDLRIARRTELADGIVGLDLVSLDGSPLPPFEPGAHVDVHVAPGVVRQYSLCNDPADVGRYRLGVLRDPASRGGSDSVHRAFAEGQVVRVGTPRCNFRLAARQQRAILFAGGIGITPLLAMAYHLLRVGVPFALHYCTRSAARTAFVDEIERSLFADAVVLHHDDGPPQQRLDLAAALGLPEAHTHLYVCGPSGFIDFVRGGAIARKWPDDRIHVERFTADVDTSGDTFEVVAARSGVSVDVAAGESIVQALARKGVAVPVSCEQGVCGTCLTNVLEGRPDHRDLYLTDDEKAGNTLMMPCCSRSLDKRLVVDL